MSNYTLNLKTGTITGQLKNIFQDIAIKRTAEQIRKRVNTAIDREMSKVFQRIALNILNNDFDEIQPYLPAKWKPYARGTQKRPRYRERKLREKGHLDWFKYGRPDDDQQLMVEFYRLAPSRVLNTIGQTTATVSSNKKRITIAIAPKVNVVSSNMERQLYGLISDKAEKKLQNRRKAYRSLIGPEFIFMLAERIPALVQRSLSRF